MKNLILSIAATAAVFVSINAPATPADNYPMLTGGNTILPSGSTNQDVTFSAGVPTTNNWSSPVVGTLGPNTNLLIMPVSEFDYAGLTFGFTGTATSTNSLLVFPSYDKGATFATVPLFQALLIAPGAAPFLTNSVLDVHGVTTLAFVIRSPGTTVSTNALLEINLKSPKYGAKTATQ